MQAEDGIRDLVRSRGLGDVYKRQVSPQNYLLCEPYTKWMVAQDSVNQAASVLLTSVAAARELGIPESQWVYLTGYADVDDQTVLKLSLIHI